MKSEIRRPKPERKGSGAGVSPAYGASRPCFHGLPGETPAPLRLRISCFLLLSAVIAAASPLNYSKRIVNGQTVDLTPLFHWWKGHEGERPLKAWVHVTGRLTESSAWGWIITAQVEHVAEKGESAEKELKIILRSPPTAEKEEFDRLKNQLNALQSQRSQLSSQAATAASESKQYSHQRHGHAVSAAYHQQETADKDQVKHIDEQIKEIDQKLAAFPEHDKFAVDCFALRTGQVVNGLPVYDHGMGVK